MVDFYFYAKRYFFFLSFLNLGTQIRYPQNRYTDFKSALDQSQSDFILVLLITEDC